MGIGVKGTSVDVILIVPCSCSQLVSSFFKMLSSFELRTAKNDGRGSILCTPGTYQWKAGIGK